MKCAFIAIVMLCLNLVAIPQVIAAPAVRCAAEVLRSEELPYGPIRSWLVKAVMKITPLRGPAFVVTLYDYVPWQTVVRRGDTFHFNCERIETYNFHLRDIVR